MAIVEDEVRNDSEEENEIEVVVEEDEADHDSDDSDDDETDEILEHRVNVIENSLKTDPYNYEDHVLLIQTLWRLSDLDRWRAAYDRMESSCLLKPEHWLLRIQTEMTLAHSVQTRDHIAKLFHKSSLDCYSIPILTEWCSWSVSGTLSEARTQLDEVLTRGGADPINGKLFWDARLELEKTQLEAMSESDEEYKTQQKRVLWCLEEASIRPLMRAEEAWKQLQEFASTIKDQNYIDKAQKQHEAAMEYLQKITPFEDKLLTLDTLETKLSTYKEYIDIVKQLSLDEKYADCDSKGILRMVYDRATSECISCPGWYLLLVSWTQDTERHCSRASYSRVLAACARRCPRKHLFWTRAMQLAEKEEKDFGQVKAIFETALLKGMESYKESELLWLSYLEYVRRQTAFDDPTQVERLRKTFRLAWDSLAEVWGEEANDCEVPLFWARLEYRRLREPKAGKAIFEELFKYGDNKEMAKYWEALLTLEYNRNPQPSEHKLRDLFKRALKFVIDYPSSIVRAYTDFERDYGYVQSMRECSEACEAKIKLWREKYFLYKEKTPSQKAKGKKQQPKKSRFDKKSKKDDDKPKKEELKKGKRKRDADPNAKAGEESEVKRKKDDVVVPQESKTDTDTGGGVKRPHDDEESAGAEAGGENKRKRTDSASSEPRAGREACTLFVSNLEFKVDEQKVREELSKYGEIVSLRVKAGVKAFGGSICYCQYTTPESVEEALKHDRSPLDGRPMFFSRYSVNAKKDKPTFKYATTTEKNKLFVKNLPFSYCTKEKLEEVFDKHGKLKDIRIVTHKDGRPKGLAYIEYEDEASAALAIEKTHGTLLAERKLDVAVSAPPPRRDVAAASLGQPKREATKGMRRTQLSNLIPSVLQKPSTSKTEATPAPPAANGSHSNANGEKRPLSNADFRSMLLK